MEGKDKSEGIGIEIELGDKVEAKIEGSILSLKGPKGEITRDFLNKDIAFKLNDKKILLKAFKLNKRSKKLVKSMASHIRNMVQGCIEGYKYCLKICSGHFPMNVSVANNQIIIKNFLGEKVPRTLKLKSGAQVKVEGELVVVESVDKELAGQVSADIEELTKRSGYDGRIFQDGIWIISKDGSGVS